MSDAGNMKVIFAALASESRLALVRALAGTDSQQCAARSITALAAATEMSRFAASRHLSVLVEARVVEAKPLARSRIHSLNTETLEWIEDWLCGLSDVRVTLERAGGHP